VAESTRYGLRVGPLNRSLRAADRDREAVAEILRREHLVGRLDDGELEERLERCLVAKRYADLDALIADFPSTQPTVAAIRPRRARHAAAAVLVALVALIWLLSLLGWAARHHPYYFFPPPSSLSGSPQAGGPGQAPAAPSTQLPQQAPTNP
jgi:DUF1707 SHOCT-like domain